MTERNRNTLPKLLKPTAVAAALSVSRSLVYDLIEKGKLPHYKVGVGRGAIRVSEDDVVEFLRTRRRDLPIENENPAKRRPRQKLRHLRG
jgi:excisionase family DNA binding protein